MAAKIYKINFKSDFVLTIQSDAGWAIPFCIKFWTGVPAQAYFAGFDGKEYRNCRMGDTSDKLVLLFDDHHLPIGELKMQIAYHTTIEEFPTVVMDEVTNAQTVKTDIDGEEHLVVLDFTGETAPEIQFSLPAYAKESQRIANEQQRIANEEQRISHEAQRIANEEQRQQNEQTRINNEAQRIRQEQARVQAENDRVSEFATLKHDAQEATTAANDAAALASAKAALANDKALLAQQKAELAQAAAALANEKAQLAADKAALANDAAALSNEKAALAQQKAEFAQTQGQYAKEQGDYAKSEIDGAKGDFESLDARFDHVDEISMYWHEVSTPSSDPELVQEYARVLEQAYQCITDLLTARTLSIQATAAANQAAQRTLAAISQALQATNDANNAAAYAIEKGNEIEVARGSYPSLSARLDAMQALLNRACYFHATD